MRIHLNDVLFGPLDVVIREAGCPLPQMKQIPE